MIEIEQILMALKNGTLSLTDALDRIQKVIIKMTQLQRDADSLKKPSKPNISQMEMRDLLDSGLRIRGVHLDKGIIKEVVHVYEIIQSIGPDIKISQIQKQ